MKPFEHRLGFLSFIIPTRRLVFAVTLLAAATFVSLARAAATFAPGTALTSGRVLILGDSITQDGRYVSFVEYYLNTLPGASSDVISIGLSSETLSGLSEQSHPFPRPCVLERLDRALKAVKPAVVVACYGMNDGIYHPPSAERAAAFKRGLEQLISNVRNSGAKLVLLTPPVFDERPIHDRTVGADAAQFGYSTPFVGYDEVLAEFARVECALPEAKPTEDIVVIDLHRTISDALNSRRASDPTFTFTPDGVHPGDAGHLLIAHALLRALGYTIPDTDGETELARIKADPRFSLIADQRQLRSEAWLPFVGYQRGETFKSASVNAAEKVVQRLQEEINHTAVRP